MMIHEMRAEVDRLTRALEEMDRAVVGANWSIRALKGRLYANRIQRWKWRTLNRTGRRLAKA